MAITTSFCSTLKRYETSLKYNNLWLVPSWLWGFWRYCGQTIGCARVGSNRLLRLYSMTQILFIHTMFFGAGSFQSLQRTVTFIDFWLNNKPPNVIISDSPNSADSLVHRFTVLSIFSDNLFVPVWLSYIMNNVRRKFRCFGSWFWIFEHTAKD